MVSLYVPEWNEYDYQERIQKDEETMRYNAGYDVSYDGYHYDTGCIDFPKNKWKSVYEKRRKENRYFAYIKDEEKNIFVGYVNYQYNQEKQRYDCGIVIEYSYRGCGYAKEALMKLCVEASKNGIDALYDSFELDRENAIHLFESMGFKIIETGVITRFSKEVPTVLVRKNLKKEL